MFDGKLYLTHGICNVEQIPKQFSAPVKSKPAKPAAERAGKPAAQSASTSSSNPRPVPPFLHCPLNMSKSSRLFGPVKRSFVRCLCNGHAHNGNIVLQWD